MVGYGILVWYHTIPPICRERERVFSTVTRWIGTQTLVGGLFYQYIWRENETGAERYQKINAFFVCHCSTVQQCVGNAGEISTSEWILGWSTKAHWPGQLVTCIIECKILFPPTSTLLLALHHHRTHVFFRKNAPHVRTTAARCTRSQIHTHGSAKKKAEERGLSPFCTPPTPFTLPFSSVFSHCFSGVCACALLHCSTLIPIYLLNSEQKQKQPKQ
jgi:hypothetical protein